ncbi:hypothetical protein [Streptomyces spectabilis]|uniref:Uncharacterized protein n=1 Tax=Streptomyces spectabilis TaxID=68270 RepID=A0A7W8B607_STRST|nr:hypothetical protein [Streptomyces spectabilis]MBB5109208.1 hypothetical protein [Streptomyces spectabilis]MCI3907763.1 hypothetical protein [Streptomyces spectabilis]GGV51372.1 hypothetical protein GCM10010245_80990 [Streptomyces spectabilis]
MAPPLQRRNVQASFNLRLVNALTAEDPTWYVLTAGNNIEEYDGTSAQYGRDVLENWITDASGTAEDPAPITDEYGNPHIRVIVRFSDEAGEHDERIAVVGSDELDTPPAELSAVDAARDAKLYAKYLDRLADDQLEGALVAARKSGHGANDLARRAAPAVSRPIALRMMSS